MKTRYHFIFLLFIISMFILLLYSSEMLNADLRKAIFRFPNIDTIGHFISFFSLTWVAHSIIKLPLKEIVLTLIFYAALTELGQAYLGFRTGEFTDFLADVVGIVTFMLLKYSYQYIQSRADKKAAMRKYTISSKDHNNTSQT